MIPKMTADSTVLIVDDEKNTREGLRRWLEDDFDVYLAADAAQAQEVLKATPIDVMVTDLRLGADDGMELIGDIRTIYDNYGFETQILAASIRSANHMKDAALIGADVATAPPNVIKAMASHVLTDKGLDGFMKDWAKTGQKIL